jgi:hypothetical protein
MAVGDLIQVKAASGTVTYQPAPGVEVVFKGVETGTANTSASKYGLTDGTTNYAFSPIPQTHMQIFTAATNSLYVILYSYGAGYEVVLSGIQTKGSALKVGDKVLTGKELSEYREQWLSNRVRRLKIGESTIEVVNPKGEKELHVLQEIIEDRDSLGELRGLICIYQPKR